MGRLAMSDEQTETSSLDKYKEELARDTDLGIRNLREKSLTLSAMEAKWAGYYVAEKQQLKRVQEMRQRYVADKNAKEMAGKDAFSRVKASAAPDENLRKLDRIRNDLELSIEFIHEAMGIMRNMTFNVKNSIEIFKMENA